MKKIFKQPFVVFIILAAIAGLLTFRDYGLTWDEPLYYEYGRASRYAYSIAPRLDGSFDIKKSFGASPDDHVTRGPAYLLIGGLIESAFESTGLDMASAWHLTNFFTFLVGLIVLHSLARNWLEPLPAALSVAFFALQPVIWNHAFINPKDIPFMILFLASMISGFRMIDNLGESVRQNAWSAIAPGILLGVATAIRFLAPYAALLLFIYLIAVKKWKRVWIFIPYGIITFATMTAFWPFLWSAPLEQYLLTLNIMQASSETSASLKVLFMGEAYAANELPRRYFPVIFGLTLTEPVWILFAIGLFAAFKKYFRERRETAKLAVIFLWFAFFFALLVIARMASPDNFRHYLFIVPPVFIFAGFGINELLKRASNNWLGAAIAIALLAPAIYHNIRLHPYQYAYYNSFAGGTSGAFRQFETDYWLTCYREATLLFNETAPENSRLFVRREPYIAAYYANADVEIRDFRTEKAQMQSGDYYLVNSRTNEDLKFMEDEPAFIEIAREGATFCVIKKKP